MCGGGGNERGLKGMRKGDRKGGEGVNGVSPNIGIVNLTGEKEWMGTWKWELELKVWGRGSRRGHGWGEGAEGEGTGKGTKRERGKGRGERKLNGFEERVKWRIDWMHVHF